MGLEMALGAAVTGMFGLLQSDENRSATQYANAQQFAQNKALMGYQNELQRETWNAQQNAINEYNSPKAQQQRLKEAGINPNFMGDVEGNYSSVSPEASVGLASTSPQPAQNTFADALSRSMELLLQNRGLDINKQDADTRQKEAESSIAVQGAELENLLKQKDKTQAEIDEINKRVSQMDEELRLKVDSVRSTFEQNKIAIMRNWISLYDTKWHEEVSRFGASTDRMNAVTNRQNASTAYQSMKNQAAQFDKTYDLKCKDYQRLINEKKLDTFFNMVEATCVHLGATKVTLPRWVAEGYSIMNTYVENSNTLSPEFKAKLAPQIDKIADTLNRKFNNMSAEPDDFKISKPMKPYLPADVSDGY